MMVAREFGAVVCDKHAANSARCRGAVRAQFARIGNVFPRLSGAVRAGLVLAQLASAVSLHAQAAAREVRGVVMVGDSIRVSNAIVTLVPNGLVTRTSEQGLFTFRGLASGAYELEVRSVGYLPDTTRLVVGAAGTTEVVVRLQPQTLERVSVTAVRSGLPRVADRERRGLGAVMYADEIARSTLFNAADLLRFSPRFQIGDRTNRRHREIMYVDGRPIRDSSDIPDKRDIAAIEAHRGYMGVRETDLWIPYNEHPLSSARVVMIWTIQYMAREQQKHSSP